MSGIVIRIPGRPPTPNARGKPQAQWARARTWRKLACTEATLAKPFGWQPLARCRVLIEFTVPTKAHRDWDNIIASTKPLSDGLTDAGIWAGDTSEVIADLSFRIVYLRGVAATTYTVESIP